MKKILLLTFILMLGFTKAQSFDHSAWSTLLKENVSTTGKVNYRAIKSNPYPLHSYLEKLSNAQPNRTWSKAEVLAFYINAYNAFTIKLIIDNYPIKSIKSIKNPWRQKFITLDGKALSLNDIEHNILRKLNEPRIHFAINCASISCPKLHNSAFTSTHLDEQLEMTTKAFINSSENTITATKIQISKLFSWFRSDFTTQSTLVDFINSYTDVTIDKNTKITFKDYNWNLNE
ncbi:MAG: DUF547 domain-containing protein [Flavobacteriaceae bacterium]|nr:DUF547 domain-containing protein [Flavobacteriaceae bacterium]